MNKYTERSMVAIRHNGQEVLNYDVANTEQDIEFDEYNSEIHKKGPLFFRVFKNEDRFVDLLEEDDAEKLVKHLNLKECE